MSAFYHSFTSARITLPDSNSLLINIRTAIGPNVGISIIDVNNYTVKKDTAFSSSDLSTCQSVIDNAPASTLELSAQAWIDHMPIEEKALLLTLLDQINLIRSKLPTPLGAITPAQAIQAVKDKAATL